MLPFACPMLFGAPAVRTYADFVAHVEGFSTSRSWEGNAANGVFRTEVGALQTDMTMTGSPALSFFLTNSSIARVVQHCFPEIGDLYDAQINQAVVLLNISNEGSRSLNALNKNGYQSLNGSGTSSGVGQFLWWNWDQDIAMQQDLLSGGSAQPYIF